MIWWILGIIWIVSLAVIVYEIITAPEGEETPDGYGPVNKKKRGE